LNKLNKSKLRAKHYQNINQHNQPTIADIKLTQTIFMKPNSLSTKKMEKISLFIFQQVTKADKMTWFKNHSQVILLSNFIMQLHEYTFHTRSCQVKICHGQSTLSFKQLT